MIVVNLKGGLGNQLFQYSLGYSLSKIHCKELVFNTTSYKDEQNGRTLDISNLNINLNIVDNISNRNRFRFEHPLLNQLTSILSFKFDYHFESTVNSFNPKILRYNNGYFDGYWQSEEYFKDFYNDLRKMFAPKIIRDSVNSQLNTIVGETYVSLHIRRTDYLNEKNANLYATCSLDYYKKAINIMKNNVKNFKVIVFSDDYEWVKNQLDIGLSFETASRSNSAVEDLFLMSNCSHNIIANSSFSWWAAWLNGNLEKLIIAPKLYYQKKSMRKINIFPNDWIRLDN